MNTEMLRFRLRSALNAWFVPLVVVLLVVAVGSGWLAYAAVADPVEPTEYRTVERWSTTAELSHSAVVREPNAVYSVGERVDEQPRYYTAVMPSLDGTFQYVYNAPNGTVDIETDVVRVVRAVAADDGGREYWAVEETLVSNRTQSVSPGDQQTTSFAVDIGELAADTDATTESLGSSAGSIETLVRIDVTMTGRIDGEAVDHSETYELLIDATSGSYTVETPNETGHTVDQSVPVSRDTTAGLTDAVGPLAVLVLSVGCLGTISTRKYRGTLTPTPAEQQARRAAAEREQLDEWISHGELPSSVSDRSRIEVASLTELVDVAIDCNRRVIERDATDEFVVVDSDVLYAFTPSEPPQPTVDTSTDTTVTPNAEMDKSESDATEDEHSN